jgi:uncharacterized phage-associated protein
MQILSLAYYILNNFKNVSPMKLQKLLYYVKAWSMVGKNPIVHEPFKKWQYGPVNDEVYQKFKHHGSGIIQYSHPQPSLLEPNPDEKKMIDFILECYAPFDAITLSSMTHQDLPWKQTPLNHVISDKLMLDYYAKLPFAHNFPLDESKPFYPVETDLHYAYIFDMDEKSIETLRYPSYTKYKQLMQESMLMLENSIPKINASDRR